MKPNKKDLEYLNKTIEDMIDEHPIKVLTYLDPKDYYMEVLNSVKEYQCCGCAGSGENCYEVKTNDKRIGCTRHTPGTRVSYIGKIFLGLPKGFNRLGVYEKMKIDIYKKYKDWKFNYDKFNIPVWKYFNGNHTIVRFMMPRVNQPGLQIFLENCINKIDCLEITEKDIKEMD